ncbi:unnamed protein product [Albugo candida]|uniref:Uncharacterized protein n=1 Tax=Albugo candida TaxID=65357 RepID=A0A024FW80_9STRA|nr:unnamed protein product [Albugo candida]|eukprot:CCI11375.1 unnamed protein product [Albugo candida]
MYQRDSTHSLSFFHSVSSMNAISNNMKPASNQCSRFVRISPAKENSPHCFGYLSYATCLCLHRCFTPSCDCIEATLMILNPDRNLWHLLSALFCLDAVQSHFPVDCPIDKPINCTRERNMAPQAEMMWRSEG